MQKISTEGCINLPKAGRGLHRAFTESEVLAITKNSISNAYRQATKRAVCIDLQAVGVHGEFCTIAMALGPF